MGVINNYWNHLTKIVLLYSLMIGISAPVSAGTQTQTITVLPYTHTKPNQQTTISVTPGKSTNQVVFTVANTGTPDTCALVSQTGTSVTVQNLHAATAITANRCFITATQAGDATYADTVLSFYALIDKLTPAPFDLSTLPTNLVVSPNSVQLSVASAGASSPVVFTSNSTGFCNVTGSGGIYSVKALNATNGSNPATCRIFVSQVTDIDYLATPQTFKDIPISKGISTLSFVTPPSEIASGTSLQLSVTRSGSTLAISPGVEDLPDQTCVISPSLLLSTNGRGRCTIKATVNPDSNYNGATTMFDVIVKTKQLLITELSPPGAIEVGKFGLVGISSDSNLPLNFAVADSNICTVEQTSSKVFNINAKRSGTCKITFSQPGNTDYLAAPSVSFNNITINKNNVPVTINPVPPVKVGTTVDLSAAGDTANTRVAFSTSSSNCDISLVGNTYKLNARHVGDCFITASRMDDPYTVGASDSKTISIGKGSQTDTVTKLDSTPLPASILVGTVLNISASGTASSIQVEILGTSPSVCDVAVATPGNTASRLAMITTTLTGGQCTFTVSQAGNADYDAFSQTYSVMVNRPQTLTFQAPLPTLTFNDEKPIMVSSTNTANPVILSSLSPNICKINSSIVNNVMTYTVKALAATSTTDLCIIAANQVAVPNYEVAKEITVSLTVSKASQSITFLPLTDSVITDVTRTITASASSNLPVAFSASPSTTCGITGNVLTLVKAGVCTIVAMQEGNPNYNAAPNQSQTLLILAPPSTTELLSSANPAMVRKAVTFSVTVRGNNPTGTVGFFDGTTLITGCSAVVLTNGTAACTTTALKEGVHQIMARYNSADGNNQNSDSPALTQVIRGISWLPAILDILND